MAKNGYFQLVEKDEKVWLQVYSPEPGGEEVASSEVIDYLELISFPDIDIVSLDNYIKAGEFESPFLLREEPIIPENERCVVTIPEKAERALARFYPPSTNGALLTEDEIVSDLKLAGIRHGIKRKAIEHFLAHHEYCKDYIIAEATLPVEGHSASIEYFFDVNVTAKPKLNEDGSVDFHQLGNIKLVESGDKLATLTPADRGKQGISVTGNPLLPKKVKNRRLRFGRNIRISKDKCNIYSKVSGHVSLVDDMVMVSDVYQVPANVDSSTGDIDFNGTVQVTGNVNTGYTIKAEGDIIVNGVVEGAVLISGGNIVLKRGMQGMDRGELRAAGNITAKFLENCKVKCGGSLKADAVLHSDVECGEKIEVLGKKGLINGGSIMTYADIHATSFGSTMGSATRVEIISDKELLKHANTLAEKIEEIEESLKKIEKAAEEMKKQVQSGQGILPEQLQYIKKAGASKPVLIKEWQEMKYERESILSQVERNKYACIRVEDTLYSGVKLIIKDVMKIQHEKLSHCRIVRDGADLRVRGL